MIAILCTTVAQKNSVHIIIYIYIYIYLIYLSYISYIIYRHLIQTFLSVCTFIYEPYSIKPYFTETMIYVKLDAEAANTAHSYYLYFLYFNEQYIIYIAIEQCIICILFFSFFLHMPCCVSVFPSFHHFHNIL